MYWHEIALAMTYRTILNCRMLFAKKVVIKENSITIISPIKMSDQCKCVATIICSISSVV